MRTLILVCTTAAILGHGVALGALNIPSDGSDGSLVITNDTVIDLSQAVTGRWDTNNTAHAGKGVYDAEKWAVVFKYSSVTVSAGTTVTFKNHASRAPVMWLVKGDVTINGTLNLDGQHGLPAPWLAEPGPGGFRGGAGSYSANLWAGSGLGVGGGGLTGWPWERATGGSYGSAGTDGASPYGNPSLIPLVGGSGGSGWLANYDKGGQGGGAGAGAMLIASSATCSISGSIHANGGRGRMYEGSNRAGGCGSGGSVRLVADTIIGEGVVQALGGGDVWAFIGGFGRIRIERVSNSSTLQIAPDPSVVALASGATPQIWMPESGPSLRIVSIGGLVPSSDPRADFGATGPDVALPETSSTAVVVETSNVERASAVVVRVAPRFNLGWSETNASLDQVLSEDPLVIRWKAEVPVNGGYSAMQVKVVRP